MYGARAQQRSPLSCHRPKSTSADSGFHARLRQISAASQKSIHHQSKKTHPMPRVRPRSTVSPQIAAWSLFLLHRPPPALQRPLRPHPSTPPTSRDDLFEYSIHATT